MIEDDSNPKSLPFKPAQVSEVGSEPRNTAATEYKRHPVYSPSKWLLEFTSSILALVLLIGIAIIFWYMDNKPLSAWRGRVSLNATISILTTACATALMHGVSAFISQSKWLYFKNESRKLVDFEIFDGASRGIWRAILLLWSPSTVSTAIAANLVYRKGIKVQTGTKIRDRPLCRLPPRSQFGHCQAMRKPTILSISRATPVWVPFWWSAPRQTWTGWESGVAERIPV